MSAFEGIQVPDHIDQRTGCFCAGGGLATRSGRCQYGCDHAEHYANDGHAECEEPVVVPTAVPGGTWTCPECTANGGHWALSWPESKADAAAVQIAGHQASDHTLIAGPIEAVKA